MNDPEWKQGPDFDYNGKWTCMDCNREVTEIEVENNDNCCPYCGARQY